MASPSPPRLESGALRPPSLCSRPLRRFLAFASSPVPVPKRPGAQGVREACGEAENSSACGTAPGLCSIAFENFPPACLLMIRAHVIHLGGSISVRRLIPAYRSVVRWRTEASGARNVCSFRGGPYVHDNFAIFSFLVSVIFGPDFSSDGQR